MFDLISKIFGNPILSGIGALASIFALVLTVLQMRALRQKQLAPKVAPESSKKTQLPEHDSIREGALLAKAVPRPLPLFPLWVGTWFAVTLGTWTFVYSYWATSPDTEMYFRIITVGVISTGGPYATSLLSFLLSVVGKSLAGSDRVESEFERIHTFSIVSGAMFLALFVLFIFVVRPFLD